MKIQTRLILLIGLVLILAFAGLEALSYYRAKEEAVADLRMSGERIYQLLMSVRRVYHKQFLASGVELNDHTIGFLPAHAMARISLDYSNWDKSGLSFNNVSDIPRNSHQQADALELKAMAYFRENPKVNERFVAYRDTQGKSYYHFTRPIWIESYCLKCHGKRDEAPATIRNHYNTAYDYKVGELRGVMSIKLPADYIESRVIDSTIQSLIWHGTSLLVLYLLVWLVVQRYIGFPMRQLNAAIGAVATGNFTQRIGLLPGEFNILAQTFDNMANALKTERDKLALSEKRFRSIANSTPDAIIVIDSDGLVLFWNPGAEQMFGHGATEAVGREAACIIPENLRIAHQLALSRLKQGGEPRFIGRTREITGLHSDGRLIRLDISLSRWMMEKEYYYAAVLRDVTERRRVEEELANYRRHLEEMVAVRTKELNAAKELAEAANRAKTVFLANMSHELRMPLNAILGFAQILERDLSLTENQRNQIQIIDRSGQHLLGLINGVLEIARIEAGKIVLDASPFNLEETLRSVAEMVTVRARSRNLQFVQEYVGKLPNYVNGDASRLRQVLINLLSNAIKYASQGHVTLRVSVLEPPFIKFEVIDEGPGIAPEEQDRIFQPFYQTKEGAAQGEGVGLGLAISREYAHLMGGSLSVNSALGQGSNFCCELPLPEVTQSVLNNAEWQGIAKLASGQPDIRMLIVDDHLESRQLLMLLLTGAGFKVQEACNGLEAIQKFSEWQPHLIWMDIRMPIMNGYDATRRIRDLPGGNSVRIVAITANAFHEDNRDILAAGCDLLVIKPISTNQLFDAAKVLLGVRFDYEQTTTTVVHTANDTRVNLAILPEALRIKLQQAAELLDGEAVLDLIMEIDRYDAEIAVTLKQLAEDFRFDEILHLCEASTTANCASTT